jgi:hypothetical protein
MKGIVKLPTIPGDGLNAIALFIRRKSE